MYMLYVVSEVTAFFSVVCLVCYPGLIPAICGGPKSTKWHSHFCVLFMRAVLFKLESISKNRRGV